MADRRRITGPSSGSSAPSFHDSTKVIARPVRRRKDNELRSIFLQTGVIPAASGSAYFELTASSIESRTFIPVNSTIKLSCAVHGPKPLARNASFSPNLQLNGSIKFAPFATRQRRGYIRDSIERDLGSHLENALRGVIIPDRFPKSSIDIAVIVLEGEEDCLWAQEQGLESGVGGVGLMNVLAGSVTVAAAALADAGIDCLDLISGGVAAMASRVGESGVEILDPCPSEHEALSAACFVAYLPARDEITEMWSKGGSSHGVDGLENHEKLISAAVRSARGMHSVLMDVVKESVLRRYNNKQLVDSRGDGDVEMKI